MSDVSSIPDEELIRRAITSLRRVPRTSRAVTRPLWWSVSDLFCLGSTYSIQLCHRSGFDPDQQVLP